MGQYYAINGSFLLEPALGVQRYAAEILVSRMTRIFLRFLTWLKTSR